MHVYQCKISSFRMYIHYSILYCAFRTFLPSAIIGICIDNRLSLPFSSGRLFTISMCSSSIQCPPYRGSQMPFNCRGGPWECPFMSPDLRGGHHSHTHTHRWISARDAVCVCACMHMQCVRTFICSCLLTLTLHIFNQLLMLYVYTVAQYIQYICIVYSYI